MYNYESPIELIFSPMKLVERFRGDLNERIFSAVQECDIRVHKAQLEAALKYDRDQYRRGYTDGFDDGVEVGRKDALAAIEKYLKGEANNEKESGEKAAPVCGEEEPNIRREDPNEA